MVVISITFMSIWKGIVHSQRLLAIILSIQWRATITGYKTRDSLCGADTSGELSSRWNRSRIFLLQNVILSAPLFLNEHLRVAKAGFRVTAL
jgi:hypothetical protein